MKPTLYLHKTPFFLRTLLWQVCIIPDCLPQPLPAANNSTSQPHWWFFWYHASLPLHPQFQRPISHCLYLATETLPQPSALQLPTCCCPVYVASCSVHLAWLLAVPSDSVQHWKTLPHFDWGKKFVKGKDSSAIVSPDECVALAFAKGCPA